MRVRVGDRVDDDDLLEAERSYDLALAELHRAERRLIEARRRIHDRARRPAGVPPWLPVRLRGSIEQANREQI